LAYRDHVTQSLLSCDTDPAVMHGLCAVTKHKTSSVPITQARPIMINHLTGLHSYMNAVL